jgi:peroxiredoxin Q/BCP
MLKVGDKAPAFSLLSDNNEKISLKDLKGKTVVLYFYPKDMTPGCTTESCDFQSNLTKFNKKNVVILGVSKDSVKSHQKFKEKEGLKFPLLSDEDGKMCEAYGVWKEKSMYGKKYMGIERTTFVISPTGVIEKIYEKVKVDGHVDEVLNAIGV